MNILFLHEHVSTPGHGGGGAESFLQDQMEAMTLLGHKTMWWHNDMPLEHAITTFRPDVVSVGTIHTQIGVAPIQYLQSNRIPHVWQIMDYYPFCVGTDGLSCTGRMMLINGDQSCPGVSGRCPSTRPNMVALVNGSPVVALNQYTAEIYRRHGMRVDYVLELGIDTTKFCPGERSSHVSIYTSTAWLMPHKGIHFLKAALEGTGHRFEQISGISREDVCQVIKAAHIFAFTSVYQETFGLSLCEAMATGCACVAFDVAGARAQIEHNVTGLLVPLRDTIALRQALTTLLTDTSLRERLGQSAREHVLVDHTLETLGRRLETMFKTVIG